MRLKADDFDIYMNPRILAETEAKEFGWEYCSSFNCVRCMVKRPMGI
jgi:peptide deformylase